MPKPILPPPQLRPWRRLACERVASYRVLEICRVQLQDSAGHPRGDAFTVQSNDWCNVVAITPEDELVLVWQYRFGTDALSLEIPGGVVDDGETPEQAARRELEEETGYEATSIEPLLVVEPNPAIQQNRCHTFLARGVRKTKLTSFDPQEELETVLVPASHVGDLLEGGQITHALVHSALEAYWRKRSASPRPTSSAGWPDVELLVTEIELLQRQKVLDLARRLRPGLTLEDVANPHDYPELDDPDWQYEDGLLAGVQSVLAAVRARRRDDEGGP